MIPKLLFPYGAEYGRTTACGRTTTDIGSNPHEDNKHLLQSPLPNPFLLAQCLVIHCLLMFCLKTTGTTWEEARKAGGEKGILMLLGGHTSSHIHAKRCYYAKEGGSNF